MDENKSLQSLLTYKIRLLSRVYWILMTVMVAGLIKRSFQESGGGSLF
jgi:hypothetical protein